jgi:hypothetical protein
MSLVVAQQDIAPQVEPATVDDWLSQANQFLADVPQLIERIDMPVAALFVALGIVSLLYGFRIVKATVIIWQPMCSPGPTSGGWACSPAAWP